MTLWGVILDMVPIFWSPVIVLLLLSAAAVFFAGTGIFGVEYGEWYGIPCLILAPVVGLFALCFGVWVLQAGIGPLTWGLEELQ